jgi:TPR repeat protein
MYECGRGMPADISRARYRNPKAAQQNPSAIDALIRIGDR